MLALKINQKNCAGQNNLLNYLIYFQSSLLCEGLIIFPWNSGILESPIITIVPIDPELMFLNLCVTLFFLSSVSLHLMSKGFYKISHEIQKENQMLQKYLDSQDRPNLFVCLPCFVFCPGICYLLYPLLCFQRCGLGSQGFALILLTNFLQLDIFIISRSQLF